LEDKELIEKLRNPDSRNFGFNLLVREYQEKIYWHIRKMVIDHDDANDITQEVFVKVWKKIDSFRGDSQLYTWVYRIATNECLNFLSRKKRRYMVSWGDAKKELSEKIDNSAHIEGDEVQKKLQKALLKLPDKQRLVFNMKYYDDIKYEDMSEITGTSVGSLKASYHHAVKKIEDYINNDLNL
jgi:RNA polymerase sigma-70 factor (ECF subfamily)